MVIDNFDRELKQYKEFYDKLKEFAIHILSLHNSGDKILESIKHDKYLYFNHVKYYEHEKVLIIWFNYKYNHNTESSNVWIDIDKFKEWYLNKYGNGTTKQD